MLVVILRIKVASRHRSEIVDLIRPIIGPTEAQPGCLYNRLYCETDDDDSLVLLQEWRSQDDVDEFIRSDHFKRLLAAMDLASQRPEISFNRVSSKAGLELVEKIRLGAQAFEST